MQCFDVVGLEKTENGRSCDVHEVCGSSVIVGDVLTLLPCEVIVNQKRERALAVYKTTIGSSCRVGFIPKYQIPVADFDRCAVIELYSLSDSAHDRRRSKINGGMALVRVLTNIAEFEEMDSC